jgi:hypothetical protein
MVKGINDLSVYRSIDSELERLMLKKVKVGFITDTQPTNLASQFTQNSSYRCLSHAFTPTQLCNFISQLFKEVEDKTTIIQDNYAEDG